MGALAHCGVAPLNVHLWALDDWPPSGHAFLSGGSINYSCHGRKGGTPALGCWHCPRRRAKPFRELYSLVCIYPLLTPLSQGTCVSPPLKFFSKGIKGWQKKLKIIILAFLPKIVKKHKKCKKTYHANATSLFMTICLLYIDWPVDSYIHKAVIFSQLVMTTLPVGGIF